MKTCYVEGIGELYYEYNWKKREEVKLKNLHFEVTFDGEEEGTINDVQKECYVFAIANLKKLFKMAIKEIKGFIKSKYFIENYGEINTKELLNSIYLSELYFNKERKDGFGFLGGWDADPEHGLGVKFVLEENKIKSILVGGQCDLIR